MVIRSRSSNMSADGVVLPIDVPANTSKLILASSGAIALASSKTAVNFA